MNHVRIHRALAMGLMALLVAGVLSACNAGPQVTPSKGLMEVTQVAYHFNGSYVKAGSTSPSLSRTFVNTQAVRCEKGEWNSRDQYWHGKCYVKYQSGNGRWYEMQFGVDARYKCLQGHSAPCKTIRSSRGSSSQFRTFQIVNGTYVMNPQVRY